MARQPAVDRGGTRRAPAVTTQNYQLHRLVSEQVTTKVSSMHGSFDGRLEGLQPKVYEFIEWISLEDRGAYWTRQAVSLIVTDERRSIRPEPLSAIHTSTTGSLAALDAENASRGAPMPPCSAGNPACKASHRTRPLTSARIRGSSLPAIRAATARISAPMPVIPQNHRCNASSSSLGRWAIRAS